MCFAVEGGPGEGVPAEDLLHGGGPQEIRQFGNKKYKEVVFLMGDGQSWMH